MSHEVVFLPHILGQTWSQALAAARTAAREEDPRIVAARLEPWPDLVLHAAEILGQIEEYRGRGQRELLHPVTRLRFTFFGEDGVIALPYWYDGPVARMAATMAFRFAHAVEDDTGLAAYDPQQRTPLAEMGLEKFVAGYLRGRDRALGQTEARGPVPVGHALPSGRSASRRELAAGPSARDAGGAREPRPVADARPGSGDPRAGQSPRAADSGGSAGAGWLRRGGKPARGESARGEQARGERAGARQDAERRSAAGSGRETSPERLRRAGEPARGGERAGMRPEGSSGSLAGPERLRRAGEPARDEREAERRQAADSGPDASSGRLRRVGKPVRGEGPGADSGSLASPDRLRRAGKPGRGEDADRRQAGPRQSERSGKSARGAEPVGSADSARLWRPADPAPGEQGRSEPGSGRLRRGAKQAGKTPEPRKAPRRAERPDAEQPQSSSQSQPRKASRRERAEAERSRKAQRGAPAPGTEWVPRPGSPEPRDGGPTESGRASRPGDLRRVEPPQPRRAPEPGEAAGGQPRRQPPELPKGRP